jgi:hypothetical protein
MDELSPRPRTTNSLRPPRVFCLMMEILMQSIVEEVVSLLWTQRVRPTEANQGMFDL